jgi:hypothetical protein
VTTSRSEGQGAEVHVAFDATVGATAYATYTTMAGWPGWLVLGAEAGYAFQDPRDHAFNFLLAAGIGNPLLAVVYQPRLLAGTADGAMTIGMRNGVMVRGGLDLCGVELGHQFTLHDSGVGHAALLSVSVNPAALLGLRQIRMR